MKKAGLIESTRRGFIRVTERGLDVLKRNPERIDVNFLEQFPEFVEFRALRRDGPPLPASHAVETTPEEALEEAYQRLRINIESELLQRVKTASPAFFERLVVKLLVSMGTAVASGTQVRLLDGVATAGSTESSRRIGWAWTSSTFRMPRSLRAESTAKSFSSTVPR